MNSYRLFRTLFTYIVVTLTMAVGVSQLRAQAIQDDPAVLRGVDIEEHLGQYVPMGLQFIDDHGQTVTLSEYFQKGKPVVLVLAYYECPMLCNLVLNGLTQTIGEMSWKPGVEYQVLTVSINPRETYQLASAKKTNYLTALDKSFPEKGWMFLVGEESQSRALADAVGFKYYYDTNQKEYAHPAAIYLLAEDGKIARYLYGIEFKQQDLKFALQEASEGKIGNTIDKLVLFCFHYDPDSHSYVVFAGNVMRLGGVITVFLLALFVGRLWFREKRRKEKRVNVVVSR